MFKKLLLVSIILSNLVGCSNEIDYNQFDIPQQDNYENYKKDHHIDQKTTTDGIKSYKENFDEKNNKKRQEESHCAVNNFKVVKLDKVLKHWNEMTGNDNYYKIVSQNDKYVYEFYMDGKFRKTESIDKICRKYVQNERGYKMR